MFHRKTIKFFSAFVPSGLIAETENGFFYIKENKRFKFVSEKAKDSWNLKVVNVKESTIAGIKISGLIGFRDGTIIKDFGSRKIYLISNNKKMQITNPDTLKSLGYSKQEIVHVSTKEASVHQDGGILDG